ncbi:MAG: S1C family serine protease, partial [Candidatus Neomarinimicrobiota bacterium]|nr:S1C family serine protease [Candidatus Neomarinimicrobiota bacterium]
MNTLRRDESSNIGYAIPINKIKNIVEELKIRGSIDRGIDFGLLFINLYTNQLMVKYVHPRVVLENDLSVYDIVVSVNDTKVSSIKDFSDVIKRNDVRPGDIIKLKILRDDKIKIVNLKTQ